MSALLEMSASTEVKDLHQNTPLDDALRAGHASVVKLLKAAGAVEGKVEKEDGRDVLPSSSTHSRGVFVNSREAIAQGIANRPTKFVATPPPSTGGGLRRPTFDIAASPSSLPLQLRARAEQPQGQRAG